MKNSLEGLNSIFEHVGEESVIVKTGQLKSSSLRNRKKTERRKKNRPSETCGTPSSVAACMYSEPQNEKRERGRKNM